jgi:hypothetical protein
MRKYFEEQLKFSEPIKAEVLSELKGRSLYSDYKEGDMVVRFLEQEIGEVKPPYTEPSVSFSLKTIVERELDKLEKDYFFIRMSKLFPVLERSGQ